MPEITMCDSLKCERRQTCKRNMASGTVPGGSQSWAVWFDDEDETKCNDYWKVK